MRCALGWFLAILLFSTSGVLSSESAHPVLRAIDEALASGQITEGEAALYQVMYVTGSEALPVHFDIGGGEPIRCATQILEHIRRNASDYPVDIQTRIDEMLARPTGLPEYIDTEHFRIHYAIEGTHIIWGWPDPTYRDGVAEACEISWNEYHSGVNQDWDLPPSDGSAGGGTGLIDCYVKNLGSGIYGYSEPEYPVSGGPPGDYTGFFVIDNDYTGFGYPDRLDPARVTIAHEYHHVVQFGYHVSGGGLYWMEMTSTMEEDEVFDDIDDNYLYLNCFYPIPYKRLNWTNGCHEYGAFVWPRFLVEFFDMQGLSPSPGRALLEEIWHEIKWNAGDGIQRTDQVLQVYGSSVDLAFAEFGRWNVYTSYRDDGLHYEEGSEYNLVGYDRSYSSYPWFDQHPTSTKRPDRLGTSYMRFNRDAGSDHNTLTVTLDGPSTTNAVTLIAKEQGANVFHEFYMELDGNKDGTLDIEGWDHMEYAYMAVSIQNVSTDGQDYAFDVETRQGSTSAGDPPARIVVMAGNNPNPFYPSTTIRYALAESVPVTVRIVNAGGRIIRTLLKQHQEKGLHEVKWFADDDAGRRVPAGVYFYKVQAGPDTHSRKMVLLP